MRRVHHRRLPRSVHGADDVDHVGNDANEHVDLRGAHRLVAMRVILIPRVRRSCQHFFGKDYTPVHLLYICIYLKFFLENLFFFIALLGLLSLVRLAASVLGEELFRHSLVVLRNISRAALILFNYLMK